jgi:hypothetical protein
MKKILLFSLFMFSLQVYGQKTITYEEMKTITKGAFQNIECDVYTAKDGYSYKVGDTLKIGRPSNNKTFSFISEYSTLGALNGQRPEPLSVSQSGSNTIIKKITIGGNKRMGFKMYVVGKGICGICPSYMIDFEESLATGEIETKGFTKESAIAKLKQAKDLLDLGMMSQADFDKLKESLKKYILN